VKKEAQFSIYTNARNVTIIHLDLMDLLR